MRLNAELINNSLSYLNPLKERELDLRGAFEKDRYYTHDQSRVDIDFPFGAVNRSQNSNH